MRTLFWFNNDLRVRDNPGLSAAIKSGPTVAIYILDQTTPWPIQGAAAWWLHHSLKSLTDSLNQIGITLLLRKGNPVNELKTVCESLDIKNVFCSRTYTPHDRKLHQTMHKHCREKSIEFQRFPGTLLFEPEAIKNKQGNFFQVFTPYYKHCLNLAMRSPLDLPPQQKPLDDIKAYSDEIESWKLLPQNPNWARGFYTLWQPGENAAINALDQAIETIVKNYSDTRNSLGVEGTSRLSPYLRFGELSPIYAWHSIASSMSFEHAESFLRQLVWREFNAHLLFHRPEIDLDNFKPKFNGFPWENNPAALKAWQTGQTGYPVVDAAMQQLWHTGWMHNRARMIVASFLTKHLLIDWREGARWFWDTLVDADLANNAGGWQWTAGCGADAAPYFRIFNPMTQGKKFDSEGSYIRQWLPQLAALNTKYIFSPWVAPASELAGAGIRLGENYPEPIVDHAFARQRALAAYNAI